MPSHSKSDASDKVNDVLRTPIENHSLTAILPILSLSFEGLEILLSPFLVPSDTIREVILICPQTILSDARRVLKKILSYSDIVDHPNLLLLPYTSSSFYNSTLTSAVFRVRTEWVLVLDHHGLQGLSSGQQTYLLNPLSISLPVGPNGFLRFLANSSRILAINNLEPAEYLIPPFVAPTHLFPRTFSHLADSDPWLAFGVHVAKTHLEMIGGLVLPSDISNLNCCEQISRLPSLEMTRIEHNRTGILSADNDGRTQKSASGRFVLVVPHLEDLHAFMPVVCRLQSIGHIVSVLLYQASSSDTMHCSFEDCALQCSTLSHTAPTFHNWLDSLDASPDVVFALDVQDFLSVTLTMVLLHEPYRKTTLIRLPRADIPHSDWIGSLSLLELRNWNVPEITISVITDHRPHSLQRLLTSLTRARYFGERIGLRINLEQTADLDTLRVVQDFEWPHGDVFIHHRVIHGGLLPAVVESWYPNSNDSYGLLLEDDIEVSPLFFAWIKMTILRYRYGGPENISPSVFGISLYQQKMIELRPEGRRSFDARALFTTDGILNPSTPYLSQIPCSWGAVYFPQHWREFHDYLSIRLSEYSMKIHENVVPDIRSNKWVKSWKKYFIELVYLRGYVMLYPNYANFTSLSINHLEIGSHVKDQPAEEYLRKKALFMLPLMPLTNASVPLHPGLLDLPEQKLPSLSSLPVLDFMGKLSSTSDLLERGTKRRTELTGCSATISLTYNARELMCLQEFT
ncbi:uncharacterized protein BJ212DRAFT_1448453 [Suillus subaureus]|uniref:Glycosyltransferase family 2 protein n=1 Tax=Suillus subaureus TaxID=48587 RepID=A0A9P7E581_9AGAM|nr:uncharacterized protein BJ212DRAFT_1448453 [Suillus subaureus]KAG1811515.1 hypothetical protein BJ212DRAFT_1448453 [Suillus subaureus]